MPFALDSNPTQSEMSEAINYLLSNFGSNITVDLTTGQVLSSGGFVVSYLYRYIAIKYSDSIDGSTNFSDTPTNRGYYGVRNSDDPVESTNPTDYVWTKVSGGFSTTKFLFYQTNGGRQIQFQIATSTPGASWLKDAGTSVDLDIITATPGTMVAMPTIYQWTSTSTPPTRPTTQSTYTWATGTFTPVPAGWSTSIPSDTTPGDYLWAITIPLAKSVNTTTSLLDWTSVAYGIVCVSSNGETGPTGPTGPNGLNSLTAYKVQSQSAATPTYTTPTSGASAPSGWSLTAPTVAVGEVMWYIQGKYNASTTTIDGVAPNTTAWTGPIAASIFQDIRSDNWNGSNPPVSSNVATWGTQGYYISRTDGSMYLNNVYARGVAIFRGATTNTPTSSIGAAIFNDTYSSANGIISNSNTGTLGSAIQAYQANATNGYGVRSQAIGTSATGVSGQAINGTAIGTLGNGYYGIYGAGHVGVSGYANYEANSVGGYFINSYPGGVAVYIDQGDMVFGGYTITSPPGTTATFLRGDGTWSAAVASSFPANSGTATAASGSMSLLGSTSTGIAGAYVGTTGSGSTVTFDVRATSPSDRRLKEDIEDCDLGLDFVNKLVAKKYKLISDPTHQTGYGFIADEVANLGVYGSSLVYNEPTWKVGDQEGFDTIHYPSYVAVLVKAVQELSEKVKTLEKKLGV